MSTTSPASSRSARRNVASTTNVAPCSRWAGPKTSPVKLWATIMWSRTVTLNTGSVLSIGDRVAEGGRPAVGERGHHLGQVVERRRPGEERVEGGVPQQVERQRQPVPVRPGAPAEGGDGAHLAGPQAEPLRVEGGTQRER